MSMQHDEEQLERWMRHKTPMLSKLYDSFDMRLEIKALVEHIEDECDAEWEERLNAL